MKILTGKNLKRSFFNPGKDYFYHLEQAHLKMKWYRKLEYSAIALFAVLCALYFYAVVAIAFGWGAL